MFRSRFVSRIFRFRNRRSAKKNANSSEVARRSSFGPLSPPLRYPVTTFPSSTSQPSPVFSDSPSEPLTQGTPIIVAQDPDQSTPANAPISPLRGNVGPQIYLDSILLVESPPGQTQLQTHIDAATGPRRVTFQIPTPHREDVPESPLSPCSTLIAEADPAGPMEAEPPVTPETCDSAPDRAVSAAPDAQANNSTSGVRFDPSSFELGSGRARHKSLFNPQPVQADMNRFSMPPTRSAPSLTPKTNVRDGRRESKRASAMPFGSGSDPRREKRKSRWSREMSKPETQEVLRALSGI